MPVTRTILALLMSAAIALAADPPQPPTVIKVEVETLTGKTYKGELVSIEPKVVVVKTTAGEERIPVVQILSMGTDRLVRPVTVKSFWLVELTDGMQLRCETVTFKNKEVTVKLLSGTEVKFDKNSVKFALKDAHDKRIFGQMQTIVGEKGRSVDVLIKDKEGALNEFKGTIGEADADGKMITFTLAGKPTLIPIEPQPMTLRNKIEPSPNHSCSQ